MIKKKNLRDVLEYLNFSQNGDFYTKKFDTLQTELKVNLKKEELVYPEMDGFVINERQTCNFKQAENFVVFECVHRLLSQGYKPNHIELEPKWQVGHGASGGRADILIKDNDGNALLIIECKTAGSEFSKAWNTTQVKPTQLFSYVQQVRTTKFIALYASDFIDGKVKADYYLINVMDNETLLKNNPNLKSYKEATTVEEIYKVWVETYKKEYATQGLFEKSEAYYIGKDKYSLDDLKTVTSKDIQGKYHEFATIMRQHNVSGRENAFDKLVNLFLCKVVDEANNSDELKFYWKGIAYDDPFSLQDRLNHLYKVGMKKFLGENITYIENQQIDDAFSVFKAKPNMTKEIIQGFFKELKFFTNNDFAFVDVHNEELFHQNFEVLLKIVKMLQDIKLTGGEDNQFLGDMFEGFLDQGVKQSEGQFFTPMPIVKFIINSLPVEEILTQNEPKAIDYACGAGHFLNEVANHYPQEKHKNIVGIEKEYRLSKVAKVSSFMYGQDDVQIVYHDALSKLKDIKDDDFSILVANPPYSVKGFLETLSEEEREKYELIKSIEEKAFITNNAIECFFIERAKQLLKKDGVAGIILPSPILSKGSQNIATSKGNTYVQTREILLKYFDIIAIAEFGSGTFGKTGTNTVTLFLKRKANNPDMATHLEYMVNTWFEGDFSSNEYFKEQDLLARYTQHIEIGIELYKTLLTNNYEDILYDVEMFSEYKQEFEKLAVTKKRRERKHYKSSSKIEQNKIEQKELLKYVRLIEKDKLYYFALAFLNKKEVLILKAPLKGKSKNSQKVDPSFLGYEWSSRKGNEGIVYLGNRDIKSSDDSEFDDEDVRILNNLNNLNNIQTPLYNPSEKLDESKINTLIYKNFSDEKVEIPESLKEYVSKARVVDMLDFSHREFTKAFSLSPKKKIKIESKWELEVLKENCEKITKGTTPTSIGFEFVDSGINFIKIESIDKVGNFDKNKFAFISDTCNLKMSRSQLKENDILFSIAGALGRTAIVNKNILPANTNQALAIIRLNKSSKLKIKYLFLILNAGIIQEQIEGLKVGVAQPNLSLTQIGNFKIPLPPLETQEEIIKKCEVVDSEVEKANEEIDKAQSEIVSLVDNGEKSNLKKLGEICQMKAGKFIKASEISLEYEDGLYPCYGGNGLRGYVKTYTHEGSYPIIGRQGALCGNVTFVKGKFYATEHAVVVSPKVELNIKWLYHKLVIMNLNQYATGVAQPGLSVKNIEPLEISILPIEIQNRIVSKIQKLEEKIKKAKEIVSKAPKAKEEILKGYLE